MAKLRQNYTTDQTTSNNLFLPRVNYLQGNVPLHLLVLKFGLQYQTPLCTPLPLPLKCDLETPIT